MSNEDDLITTLIQRADATAATQAIVERYGVEIFSYLHSLFKDDDVASDAFATACENVYKSVLSFRGDSSVRTWFYIVARNAAHRQTRGKRHRNVDRLSAVASVLESPIRTATEAFRRTSTKSAIHKLRESLTEEEREILLLRIDRNLSWLEIAAVCSSSAENTEDDLKREAARLRKQFERAKARLRELAKHAGLLGENDGD